MELEDVKRILKEVAEYKGVTPISKNIKAQDILDCIKELETKLDTRISMWEHEKNLRKDITKEWLNEKTKAKGLTGIVMERDDEVSRQRRKIGELEASQPKWISVGEKKPELLQQVIIFYGNQYYCVTYYGEPECWGVAGSTRFHPDAVKEWAEIKLENPKKGKGLK